MNTALLIMYSMRPRQWVKNFFVFPSLLFSGSLFVPERSATVFLVFVCFCLAASAVYLCNDVADRERDRLHAVKSRRPVASGRLPVSAAVAAAVLLSGAGLLILHVIGNGTVVFTVLLYVLLNVLYSFLLKRRVILDAFCVALGFELRVWAGSLAIGLQPSAWLQVCTFLVALFLSFGKRREEMVRLKESAPGHRAVLSQYTVAFIDQLITVTAVVCILAYISYTLSPGIAGRTRGLLMYTVPLAMYGIFRYLYLITVHDRGGDPGELLLRDVPMFLDLVLWFFGVFLAIYLKI